MENYLIKSITSSQGVLSALASIYLGAIVFTIFMFPYILSNRKYCVITEIYKFPSCRSTLGSTLNLPGEYEGTVCKKAILILTIPDSPAFLCLQSQHFVSIFYGCPPAFCLLQKQSHSRVINKIIT